MTAHDIQQKSSAITLSDMEMFVFPRLLYSLVLANILSPRIWRWRDDPWFNNIRDLSPYRRVLRLKQYIMDHYRFNLDLETWGLTTKGAELARFKGIIDEKILRSSNALFGYEGDKYYFDIDIRKHFGLDKYDSEVIPYWKTETVEAMDAFGLKPGYTSGAGECVSLSTLYAAALFVVAGIDLKDIFLMTTPLHSQNFVDIHEGILTNNRRIVTKAMWINGSELSMKARRALDNERVTIVSHCSGYIHVIYPEATIDRSELTRFSQNLDTFLKFPLREDVLGSFLRYRRDLHACFQIRRTRAGKEYYIGAERVFLEESKSPYMITDSTYDKLMTRIPEDEFIPTPRPGRIVLNDLTEYVRTHPIDFTRDTDITDLKYQFASDCLKAEKVIESLISFCTTHARLPDPSQKKFISDRAALAIYPGMNRREIMAHLEEIRADRPTVDLAFYALRDITRSDPRPFLHAAWSRNPVSIEKTKGWDEASLIAALKKMPDASIYDEPGRLAQPDEVWNFASGDGLEKAILLANILSSRFSQDAVTVHCSSQKAVVVVNGQEVVFPSAKDVPSQVWNVADYLSQAPV